MYQLCPRSSSENGAAMRWIRIGERAHAVLRKNKGKTLCGLSLEKTGSITASPGFDDRCHECDNVWRRRGRAMKPKQRLERDVTSYAPRYNFNDYESETL